MDPGYGSIFQNLYSARPDTGYAGQVSAAVGPDPESANETEVIRQAIDAAEAELRRSTSQTLRSDARYFLLINLLQMVFVPFRRRGRTFLTGEAYAGISPGPEPGTFAELTSYLRDDLRLILNDAARRQEGPQYSLAPQASEISSHLVMEAIVANWSQLRLNSFRIWGER
jgi:hypothetical protein